jgi:hypothetical protein
MSNITAKPIKPQDLDHADISISPMKTMASGARMSFVNYKGNKLYLQTPNLGISYDTGTYYPETDKSGKYAVKVSMDGYQTDESIKAFHDAIQGMDQYMIQTAVESSGDWFENLKWFKKKGSDSVEEKVTENYTPMLKLSVDKETGEPNGKWPPGFTFKIVKKEGKVECDLYDSDKKELCTEGDNPIDLENTFKKGSKVKMIIRCNALWASNVGWGCTWRAEQIRLDKPAEFTGYAFEDTDDEDEGESLVRTSSVAEVASDNLVESDSEGEEEEEEEEVVKRVIKR